MLLSLLVLLLLLTGGGMALGGDGERSELVRGSLRVDAGEGKRLPVEGARIVARDTTGTVVGEARSDAKGAWAVALPGPGRYVIALDPVSLPAGVAPRNAASGEVTLDVLRNQKAFAVFPLSTGAAAEERAGPSIWLHLLQLAVDGVVFGVVLAMAALGLSLVYGVARIVNFAHGDVVSMGALVAVFLNAAAMGPQLDLFIAAIATVALVGSGGIVLNALFGRIEQRATDHFTILVFSIGVSFVLRHALLFVFGPASQPYRQYTLQDLYEIGPVLLAPRDLTVVAVAAVLLLATGLLLLRTRVGQAMRAVSTNAPLAEQSGINIGRIRRWTWILGTALAACAGVLIAVSQQARWSLGYQLLMFIFAAVILGGIGTAFGAMVGGFVIGLVVQLSTVVIPAELKPTVAITVLIAVLLVRPLGLFNRAQRLG